MNAPIKMFINLLLIYLLCVGVGSHFNHEKEPMSATLTQIVTSLQTVGNHMYYGSLDIEWPDGVTAQLQEADPGERRTWDAIDLKGLGDAPLAPRIWITHYRADCENEWRITSALLDLLPDTTLQYTYRDRENKINLFTYTNRYKSGYILNCKNDIYLVEELTYGSENVFGGLLDDRSVRWNSGHEAGNRHNRTWISLFDKIHIGEDSFLAMRYTADDGRRWIKLICDEAAGMTSDEDVIVYQKIEIKPIKVLSEEQITYKDYNFDGYLDIGVASDTVWLWNPDEEKYVETQAPEEFLKLLGERTTLFSFWNKIDCSKEEFTYIPQGLLDKVADAMREGTELETLKAMVNDRELSGTEILSLAKVNVDLRQTIVERSWSGAYLMVMADGDNDGIMDIIARESYGGSDGSAEFVFYQGQENGTFRRTTSFPSVQEEFAILEYDGRNYLFRTLFDYEKKLYNGISITYCVDGRRIEQAELMLKPERYETTLVNCTQENYKTYAEQIAADSLNYKALFEGDKNILGSSEEKLSDYGKYQCDLDNDGVVDEYEKVLRSTSSINVCDYLHFNGTGKVADTVNEILFSLEGTPVVMWVDAVQGKNVINVMSRTGLEDIAITGFLVSGASYEQLYDIRVDATYDVLTIHSLYPAL